MYVLVACLSLLCHQDSIHTIRISMQETAMHVVLMKQWPEQRVLKMSEEIIPDAVFTPLALLLSESWWL